MKIPGCTDKTYIVMDNDAPIRRADELAGVETCQAGDEFPAGSGRRLQTNSETHRNKSNGCPNQ
jgi:hypothetical protein